MSSPPSLPLLFVMRRNTPGYWPPVRRYGEPGRYRFLRFHVRRANRLRRWSKFLRRRRSASRQYAFRRRRLKYRRYHSRRRGSSSFRSRGYRRSGRYKRRKVFKPVYGGRYLGRRFGFQGTEPSFAAEARDAARDGLLYTVYRGAADLGVKGSKYAWNNIVKPSAEYFGNNVLGPAAGIYLGGSLFE